LLKNFRRHYLLVAVLIAAVLLTGCFGGKKDEEFKVDITVSLVGGEGNVEDVSLLVGTKNVTVDKDGKATATVAKGKVAVKAVLEGYKTFEDTITVEKNLSLPIKLTAVEPEETDLAITSVSNPANFSVLIGETPFEELELPEKVEVTLSDSTKVELEVEWSRGEYDYEVAGTYVITGQLNLIDGIVNPENFVAGVQVRVRYIPEDEEELYEEAGATLSDEMDALELDAVEADLELVDTITVDESEFAVAWASSNPEVLGADGTVNRTAQDEVVVLTATLTLKTDETSAQSIKDPRVLSFEVTVLADPEKKALADAEAAVAAVKAIEGPNHYDEVEAIEALFETADEAVALVVDPLTRYGFEQDVKKERTAFETILGKHVANVNNAGTDLDLLEALEAFWTIDPALIARYQELTKDKTFKTVHEIQEDVVEEAPLYDEEQLVVAAITKAAESGSLIEFKDAMLKYETYFNRVRFNDNEALNGYKEAIDDTFTTITAIQDEIDGQNLTNARAAVTTAEGNVKRADWNKAVALLEFVADGEAKDDLQKQLDDHNLIINVSEAKTVAELRVALEELEIEYVFVPLLDKYLKAIEEATAEDKKTDALIQVIVDEVNESNVEGILKKINELKGDDSLSLVESLLLELEKATPIEKDVDFDLADKDLAYDKARLSYYLDVFAAEEPGIDSVEDVKDAIKAGNVEADAKFSHFVAEDVEVKTGQDVAFTLEAFDVGGKKFDIVGDFINDVVVKIDGKEVDMATENPVKVEGAQVTFTTSKSFDKIGTHAATLTFKYAEKSYEFNWDVEVTAEPNDSHSNVKTDKAKYVSGEDITITVTLGYADKEILTTENGTYGGKVTIGGTFYNREFAFENGVAVVTVPAGEVMENKVITVDVLELELDTESIEIVAGAPQQLLGELEGSTIKLTVADAWGNAAKYEGSKKVEVTVHPLAAVKGLNLNIPDGEGNAWVEFEDGEGEIDLNGSPLLEDLEEEKNYKVNVLLVELGLSVDVELK
jgi:hypothetical protein